MSLMSAIHEIRPLLQAVALPQPEVIVQVEGVLDNMLTVLEKNKYPSSRQAEYAVCLLRAEKFRQRYVKGSSETDVSALNALITRFNAVRYRLLKAENTWRFRPWCSSVFSSQGVALLVFPAYLVFFLSIWAWGPTLTGSVMLAVYLVLVTGGIFWVKDGVGLYWALYSFIPLALANRHLLSSFF